MGSTSSMICMARTLGAPETVPAGRPAGGRRGGLPLGELPVTFEVMCITCE